MCDGVELAADVWLPSGGGSWPIVLSRTPYHRNTQSGNAARFIERGYGYVVQDVRGKFDSDGVFTALEQEESDGRDTLDWIAEQRWCNGRIGLWGRSYLGIVQLPAASGGYEALKCIVPGVAPLDFFNDWIRYDGCFALANIIRWPFEHTTARTRTATSHFAWSDVWTSTLGSSLDDVEARLGARLESTRRWLEHDRLDEYWERLDQRRYFDSIKCPGMHQAGYFDHLSRGQFAAAAGITERGATEKAREQQYLIVGPWGHSMTDATTYGDLDFGPRSVVSLLDYSLRFLDLWLRDVDDGVSSEPRIRYFLIGENRWMSASRWPPEEAYETEWYLDSEGSAAGLGSTGTLSRETPRASDWDEFEYDPRDPVPTNGGQVYWGLNEMVPVGPTEQHPTLSRSDVLFYRSRPFAAPATIAGPVRLELWVSSSARDTDFIAKFCAIDPLGAVTVLTVGSLRCRFRHSRSAPEPLAPGDVVKLDIQMNHIACTVPADSRIGLIVTSSCFPRILPHDNRYEPTWSGAEPVVARQTVHHGGGYRSRLILSVIEDGSSTVTSCR